MGHNINVVNGKAAMAYYGEKPWHSLGTAVESAMTSGEAIEKAGLDWMVEKRTVHYNAPGGSMAYLRYNEKSVTVRTDTNEPLGIVGTKYTVLQNRDAFKFFDAIVGEKLAMFHTAGALGNGERIWMLAKLPGECWITKEDNVEKYLLLTNSHDGTSAVNIVATPIRVVCQNTLNMALKDGTKTKVRHTMNMGGGIKQIREQLGIADAYFRLFEEMGKNLVSKQATSIIVEKLFDDLGLSKEKAKESTRTDNIRYDILGLFDNGKGNRLPGVKGSAWALLNGVVEWVDYSRSAHGDTAEDKSKSRAESLLFGSGANIKQKALESILTSVR